MQSGISATSSTILLSVTPLPRPLHPRTQGALCLLCGVPFYPGQEEPGVAQRLGLSRESVRSFLYRNHRCFFVVTDDEMRVLGFIDMRQDVDTVIEERFPN